MSGKQKRGKMIILSSILLATLAAAFVIVRLPSFGRLPQGERLERIRQSPETTATAGSAIKKPVR